MVRSLFGPLAWRALLLATLMAWLSAAFLPAAAQGVDRLELQVRKPDGNLVLDYNVRLQLPRAVDEALQRGVPIYFEAQATTYRPRWYWRDERVGRAHRSWRLSFQPLTASWRVSQGGLHQSYGSQSDALAAISRATNWPIADLSKVEPDQPLYVDFTFRLDTGQLPRPMQIGIGTLADWTLQVERTVQVEPQ
ncbi:DUF4390 domain-containing protein [Aquincola tertiaricarbonis]|uniref:DUF4390 domain-containing protein n=1 Tax=Aquincola tertiaricarbonis TaxID=391953 RepID=A0ABY4SFE9_AQUTE|nr:DUF4390 domain-containing protein [Aquincola tertiaricarbonis]URI10488.1 DUF4390 domain-containing protein [Aquincola tertiaricarbonis]